MMGVDKIKIKKATRQMGRMGLKIEEAIYQTIYEYEGDLFVFFDYDGEEQYKGTIVYSKNLEKLGETDWYYIDASMKPFYTSTQGV